MSATNIRIFACAFLLLPLCIYAQHFATIGEIQTAAMHYAQYHLNQDNDNLLITNIVTKQDEQHTLLYDVQFNNGYGVILTSVKSCEPVVGYYQYEENLSILNDAELPEAAAYFIDKYCHEIAYAIDSLGASAADNDAWYWLLGNFFFKEQISDKQYNNTNTASSFPYCEQDAVPTAETVFGPYITTRWGQTSSNDGKDHNAYNHYVSETCKDCNGGKCPVGCVALAMAQIMKYWKYPAHAQNSKIIYDWDAMPQQLLTSSENYQEEKKQIAKLLYDCGQAADVKYCYSNSCESFAWPAKARDGLVEVFDYSPEATRKLRSSFSTQKWKEMLAHDLMNHQPILYGAISFNTANYNQGGHAFICDGYNAETGFFHFDWGKKGKYFDVWYNIDELICDKKNWNHLERAVFGIKPKK